jgi:hypothetical protein
MFNGMIQNWTAQQLIVPGVPAQGILVSQPVSDHNNWYAYQTCELQPMRLVDQQLLPCVRVESDRGSRLSLVNAIVGETLLT